MTILANIPNSGRRVFEAKWDMGGGSTERPRDIRQAPAAYSRQEDGILEKIGKLQNTIWCQMQRWPTPQPCSRRLATLPSVVDTDLQCSRTSNHGLNPHFLITSSSPSSSDSSRHPAACPCRPQCTPPVPTDCAPNVLHSKRITRGLAAILSSRCNEVTFVKLHLWHLLHTQQVAALQAESTPGECGDLWVLIIDETDISACDTTVEKISKGERYHRCHH
ncbi:hypothetical protein P7K49_027950 [Saguinus oedipus]|uniref:Uncharacterized protein n=1 Tax=Saguinus oedipus TaxID=9490 RepID=A0ABQ9UAX4_SAGOE|nr:hypothetical protein P7K49_027950 [Saguinus oedipus]